MLLTLIYSIAKTAKVKRSGSPRASSALAATAVAEQHDNSSQL
jgi:hypothetical protein